MFAPAIVTLVNVFFGLAVLFVCLWGMHKLGWLTADTKKGK